MARRNGSRYWRMIPARSTLVESDRPDLKIGLFVEVDLGRWDPMVARLLLAAVAKLGGAARAAAPVLGVPRSTLAEHLRRARALVAGLPSPLEPGPVALELELGRWDPMVARLLLATLAEHGGSLRAAAPVLDVPRSTLAARVRRARALAERAPQSRKLSPAELAERRRSRSLSVAERYYAERLEALW